MVSSLSVLLLGLQITSASGPSPAATADTLTDAYVDSHARELVRRARTRRENTVQEIRAYEAIARERISVGWRALGRERLFYRREVAVGIDWNRGDTVAVEVLGAREVIPPFMAGVHLAGDVEDEAADLARGPTEWDFFSDEMLDGDDEWLVYPLAPGSEDHYRFATGDTTVLRLQDGSIVRLVELEILPRRRDSQLLAGSLWLDADSDAIVRAMFRLARPFDLELDAARFDENEREDVEDVPDVFQPIRADLRFLTVEYALWNGRWWLPRLVALDATAEINNFPDFSVRFERAYTYHDVTGDSLPGASGSLAEAPTVTDCPSDAEEEDEDDDDRDADAGPADETRTECECRDGRCRFYAVHMPSDTASLLASEFLPESVYASGETLVTGEQVSRLVDELQQLAPVPWSFQRPTIRWAVAQPDLLRYNRVEALSVGARAEANFGALRADATARIGVGDWEPNVELGIAREGLSSRTRVAAYRRLASVDPPTRALGAGNSLSALLLGRDDGDYYRTLGIELTGEPAPLASQWYGWRIFAERQTAAEKHTDFSVPQLLGDDADFRDVIPAMEADQVGASLALRTSRGLNPAGRRWSAEAGALASTGTFDFVRPSASLFGAAPLPGTFVGSLEVAAGTSFGTVPVQSAWFLGGSTTLRGYAPASAIGDSYWRARTEVATSAPGARIVLFSDAGWAGPRDDFKLDDPLVSAGVGTSFLDGLIRLDLARALRHETGWRLEIYAGAGL